MHAKKKIYSECLVHKRDAKTTEKASSKFDSMNDQAKSYCEMVKKHPVFGKSDFNIIAMS